MILLHPPSVREIEDFRAGQRSAPFTYDAVGATAAELPRGFNVDRTRAVLGQGHATYEAAQGALRRWQQFRLGWLDVAPVDVPLQPEQVVVVLAHMGPCHWLNACRIVYTVHEQESQAIHRYGFAYGTLADHAEAGEERFLVEWDPATDEVAYEILAFSRPRHPLARLGRPLVRRLQKRFARDSVAAMQRL